MKQLVKLGHSVRLVTIEAVDPRATDWLRGVCVEQMGNPEDRVYSGRGYLARRFQRFWNVPTDWIARTAELVDRYQVDAIIAVGHETLPILSGNENVTRIWYVADDAILHTVSCAKETGWNRRMIKLTAINLAYERYYHRHVDAAWVVSALDQSWLRRTGGFRRIDVISNGVDTDYFWPQDVEPTPRSCAFWGRLDFPPNDQALRWFLDAVWPRLRATWNDCQFNVYGISPKEPLRTLLQDTAGVTFAEDVEDLRMPVCRAPVAVFPMVSGAGVKNKVLEAAAMGRAICATSRCVHGLNDLPNDVFAIADTPDQWVARMGRLWDQPGVAASQGQQALEWVRDRHHWARTAEQALLSIHQAGPL